jgi:hypothetical protein
MRFDTFASGIMKFAIASPSFSKSSGDGNKLTKSITFKTNFDGKVVGDSSK